MNDSRKTQISVAALWQALAPATAATAPTAAPVTADTTAGDAGNATAQLAVLASPGVGEFRPFFGPNTVVRPGQVIGTLQTLGVVTPVVAPPATVGVVRTVAGAGRARFAVAYRQPLFWVDPHAAAADAGTAAHAQANHAASTAGDLVFRAPTSGRFYGRPGPGKPAFVTVGETLTSGATICLLEVMKTFHRVTYGGDEVPARAKVRAIAVADEADVNAGDVLLVLEAL